MHDRQVCYRLSHSDYDNQKVKNDGFNLKLQKPIRKPRTSPLELLTAAPNLGMTRNNGFTLSEHEDKKSQCVLMVSCSI